MVSFRWTDLLTQWSTDLINSKYGVDLPPDVIARGWLGYPGATEEQLMAVEHRLGISLPPSYRLFLQVTNGWRRTTPFVERLYSLEEIEWFATNNQWAIDATMKGGAYVPPYLQGTGYQPLSISDEEYLVYDDNSEQPFRAEYLQSTLEISPYSDGCYLLNPRIVTADGEWEAWFYAPWNLVPARYRTFWELMQAEYQAFLSMKDL